MLDVAEETMTGDVAGGTSAPARSPELERGTNVGRHIIIVDRIGEGGMGVVYAAYDSDLDRKIALKFLHPDRALDSARQGRLLREAQAMARLSHFNVVAAK